MAADCRGRRGWTEPCGKRSHFAHKLTPLLLSAEDAELLKARFWGSQSPRGASAKWGWRGADQEGSLKGSGLLVDRGGCSAGALGAKEGVWAPHSVLVVGAAAGR